MADCNKFRGQKSDRNQNASMISVSLKLVFSQVLINLQNQKIGINQAKSYYFDQFEI
jgi:hypothetical protein